MSSRRCFGAAFTGGLLGACAGRAQNETRVRIRARPGTEGQAPKPGAHSLSLRQPRNKNVRMIMARSSFIHTKVKYYPEIPAC